MPPPASVFRTDLFAGKTAIVTGGGTGIGFQVSRELLALGCEVFICSRKQAKLEAAVASLTTPACAGRIHALVCNVRNEQEVCAFVEAVVAKKGRIDHLVNCAGGQFISEADSLSAKGFKAVVELNLIGTFQVCREVFAQSMREHGGSIVSVTMVTHNGLPRMSHSGAARAGVDNLAKSLAIEWASSGVRINTVAPGVIFTQSGFDNYGPMGQTMLEAMGPAIPFKRLGTAEEVSAAAVFLLSEGAAYTSGATFLVDGALGLCGYPFPMADTGEVCNFPVYGDESVLPPEAVLRAKL
jgi:NAD(P)-dependent dehydrogenase (short-subunit alcohol dehydrogenase family)